MNNFSLKNKCESFSYKIHMAGDISHARQICRKFVLEGACVQLIKAQYIYTGGMENGFVVIFMNYARFPSTKEKLFEKASRLAENLATELCQASYSIEGCGESFYFQHQGINK